MQNINLKYFYFSICIFIFYIISISIIIYLKKIHKKGNCYTATTKKELILVILHFVFGLSMIVIHSSVLFFNISTLSNITIALNFISIITYFGANFYNLLVNLKILLKTLKKLYLLETYNNNLHLLCDSLRGFKHDFNNILMTIGGYIKLNDLNGLKNYYSQLNFDCQKINSLCVLNPKVINNAGIYNLLAKKYQFANEKNIKLNISFMLDLNSLNMKIYEFARVLGILIDNAIEASSLSNEKVVNLTFKNSSNYSCQLIIIENTYKDKDIDIDKIFEKGISTKESHTGLGLWTVRKIIKKHNNINLFTTKNNTFFSQQLEIYN